MLINVSAVRKPLAELDDKEIGEVVATRCGAMSVTGGVQLTGAQTNMNPII
jgi:hypothetical protein